MSSKELDNLVEVDLIKIEPGDQTEFDGLVESGRKRFHDAKNAALSLESRFDLAYNAAHALALAALRWHGYRPKNKRFIVFQALELTLGIKSETWRVMDKSHTRRNASEYEGYFEVDGPLLTDLLKALEIVDAAIGKQGPVPKK